MQSLRIATLVLIASSGAASAQSMNAEAFYKRATALKAKGPLALVSRDFKPMTNEAKATGLHVRSTRLATIKAGKQPRYCPPAGSKRMGPEEFIAALGSLPAAERSRISISEAMTRVLARRHPCPSEKQS